MSDPAGLKKSGHGAMQQQCEDGIGDTMGCNFMRVKDLSLLEGMNKIGLN